MDHTQALVNYHNLLKKIDLKFEEVFEKHKEHFQCGKGCYSCCKKELSVFEIEALNIKKFIQAHLESFSLDKGIREHCEFLNEKGECLIYEARPVICRSHGAPVAYKNAHGEQEKSVCNLNFTEVDLNSLELIDFYNLETVNVLLSLINQTAGFTDQRVPLKREVFFDKIANSK